MYRPVMLMASDHRSTTQQEPSRTCFGSEESKQPDSATKTSSKGRARNKSGRKNPKKPAPQRGVGVAQLERLRLQQRWNKLTQMPLPQTQVVQSLNLPENQRQQFQHYQNPTTTRPDPLLSVPVLYGASNYEGSMSSSSGLVVQSVNANGGFRYGYNVCAHNDVGGLVVDPNQYGVGAPNPYRIGAGVPTSGAVYEISNDLSSIPKMKQQPLSSSSSSSSEYCCCCKQKKRFNCGNNMGFGVSPAVFPMVNGPGLPGFDPRNIPKAPLAGETDGGFNGSTYLVDRHSLVDESVEVRAVHRKGRQAGGDIMMEYEFFPDHNNNSSSCSVVSSGTYPMDHELVASSANSSSVGRSPEASDQYLGGGGAANATYIEGADIMMMSSCYSPVDLSLKLSF